MTRELLATIVIVPAVLVPVVLTWWLTVKLVPPGPRRLARWLHPAIVLILAHFVVGGYVASNVRQGDHVCPFCGGSTGIVSFAWMRFLVAPEIARGGDQADQYLVAFPDDDSFPHDHEWLPVGCQLSGCDLPLIPSSASVCCTKIDACAWFSDLPRVADRGLAARYARKLPCVAARAQADLLRSYDDVRDAHENISDRFTAWREAWRRDHPGWP
jgi:hypothetical protein